MRDSPLVLVSDVHILIGSAGVMDMCDDRPNKAGDERISSNSVRHFVLENDSILWQNKACSEGLVM